MNIRSLLKLAYEEKVLGAQNQSLSNINEDSGTGLIESLGKIFWFNNEDKINAVTAISGSGPAYIFHFMDCLNKSEIEIRIDPKNSQKIIEETLLGSVELVESENISLENLRKNVTSPGGTTKAGSKQLIGEGDNLNSLIRKTVFAAFERAKELGEK